MFASVEFTRLGPLLVLLSILLGGCGAMIQNWPPWLDMKPPPNPYGNLTTAPENQPAEKSEVQPQRASPEPNQTNSTVSRHKRKAHRVSHASLPPPVSKPPAEKNTITLTGGSANKDHADRLLDEVEKKLANVDHSRMNGSEAAMYAQAVKFVSAGREAEDAQDYVAAKGFAEKAAVLSKKMVAAGNAGR